MFQLFKKKPVPDQSEAILEHLKRMGVEWDLVPAEKEDDPDGVGVQIYKFYFIQDNGNRFDFSARWCHNPVDGIQQHSFLADRLMDALQQELLAETMYILKSSTYNQSEHKVQEGIATLTKLLNKEV